MDSKTISQNLRSLGDPARAKSSRRFFKASSAKADAFVGLSMPQLRQLVKQYKPIPLSVCVELLASDWHEVRMFALLMMVALFQRKKPDQKEAVYRCYLDNTQGINNWDLVDCSAYQIVGAYLLDKDRGDLVTLAQSPILWERRIAMVATYAFIRAGDFEDTFSLAELLINDEEDLMHKAVGWMLKEVSKREPQPVIDFVDSHKADMPRTMLRTAIEKLPQQTRYRLMQK